MRRAQLDITGEVCPMTYVRTKLQLEALGDGEELEVLLRGEEPVRNVPQSALDEGHQVVSLDPVNGEVWRLVVRKRA